MYLQGDTPPPRAPPTSHGQRQTLWGAPTYSRWNLCHNLLSQWNQTYRSWRTKQTIIHSSLSLFRSFLYLTWKHIIRHVCVCLPVCRICECAAVEAWSSSRDLHRKCAARWARSFSLSTETKPSLVHTGESVCVGTITHNHMWVRITCELESHVLSTDKQKVCFELGWEFWRSIRKWEKAEITWVFFLVL